MVNILTRAIMMSTPLLLGALAEVYAERTGMMICAIEGIFLIGAGRLCGHVSVRQSPGGPAAGHCLGRPDGSAVCLCHRDPGAAAGGHRHCHEHPGRGHLLLLPACALWCPHHPLQIDTLPKLSIPLLSKIPFIGEIFFQQNILTYMAYILIPVSIFVLYKTSLGLAIRSTGEIPWPWMWRACR